MSETTNRQSHEDIISAVRPGHQSIRWYEGGDRGSRWLDADSLVSLKSKPSSN